VLAVLLPLAGRAPRTVLVVATLCTTAGAAFHTPVGGLLIMSAAAAYRLAATTSARRRLLLWAGGAAVVIAATTVIVDPSWADLGRSAGPIVIVAFGAAFGDAMRSRRAYVDAIIERAERAERTREAEAQRRVAEERLRIARELHDAAAHQIAAINLHAGVAEAALPDRPEDVRAALGVIQSSAQSVLREISALLRVLREPEGDGAPRGTELRPVDGLAALDGLVEEFRRSGLEVEVVVGGAEHDLLDVPEVIGGTAVKVIREALANAMKHGSERRAELALDWRPPALTIRVSNPVSSLHRSELESGRHGLEGVRERVAALGGAVETERRDGRFVLTAVLSAGATGSAA